MMKTVVFLFVALLSLFKSNAFFNPQPAFLRENSVLQMTVLTYNGKKKNFAAGSPLSKACSSLGVKVTYSCKKGDCATCQLSLGGLMTKPCVAKVPAEPKLKSLQEKGLEIKTF